MRCAVFLRLLALLALSACSAGGMGDGGGGALGPSGTAAERRTDLETQQACRDRTNEMYEQRDRAQIYAPASSVNTPYSANYEPDVPSRGLSEQFAYERTKAECERAGTGSIDQRAPNTAQPAANSH
jgi:hypothetical protein